MTTPEHPERNICPSTATVELAAALADIDKQLELADENENTLERFFKRDKLLELREEIQSEV